MEYEFAVHSWLLSMYLAKVKNAEKSKFPEKNKYKFQILNQTKNIITFYIKMSLWLHQNRLFIQDTFWGAQPGSFKVLIRRVELQDKKKTWVRILCCLNYVMQTPWVGACEGTA